MNRPGRPFARTRLLICLAVAFGGGASATTPEIFLSPAEWEQAAADAYPYLAGFTASERFDDESSGALSAGVNVFTFDDAGFGPNLTVELTGPVREGRIEDDPASPLSVDGSPFLQLSLGGTAPEDTTAVFSPMVFAAPPSAYAFSFEVTGAGDTTITAGGIDIQLAAFLPEGEGFIGIVSDSFLSGFTLRSSAGPVTTLGLDNLQIVPAPLPGAGVLVTSGLLLLVRWRRLDCSGRSAPA